MRYKLMGGMRVSELALGTMTFGEDWGWGADKATSQAMFDHFAEAGGNFIDTACNYTNGTSERYVGDFIAADRDYFVVATKFTLNTDPHNPNAGGNSRRNMMRSVEASLHRLNTDYIDLLWLHVWDFTTPLEEIMRGLDDLVRSGTVMYVGISDTPAWIAASANVMADLRGWSPFVGYQVKYNLADRTVERDVLPAAQHHDMVVTPWGLIEGGGLTGKYNQPDPNEPRRRDDMPQRVKDIASEVMDIAQLVGRSPAQVAINWVRQQQHRARIVPILGARRLEQLKDNLAVLAWELSAEHMDRLAAASAYELGFPHSMLNAPHVQSMVYRNNDGNIDNHRPGPVR